MRTNTRSSPGTVGLAVLAVIAGLGWGTPAGAQTQSTGPITMELSTVDVTKIAPRDIAHEVRIAGSLTPIRRSTLTARVASKITELPVQVGDVVKKGDLLVRFDKSALESTLVARKAAGEALNAQRKVRGQEPLSGGEFLKLAREKAALLQMDMSHPSGCFRGRII